MVFLEGVETASVVRSVSRKQAVLDRCWRWTQNAKEGLKPSSNAAVHVQLFLSAAEKLKQMMSMINNTPSKQCAYKPLVEGGLMVCVYGSARKRQSDTKQCNPPGMESGKFPDCGILGTFPGTCVVSSLPALPIKNSVSLCLLQGFFPSYSSLLLLQSWH